MERAFFCLLDEVLGEQQGIFFELLSSCEDCDESLLDLLSPCEGNFWSPYARWFLSLGY